MKHIFILFFLFLVVLNIASAVSCDNVNSKDLCNEIISSNLNQTDKDYLINSLLIEDSSFPNHDFVKGWNLKINVTKPLNDTKLFSSLYIKNAWVKIFSVMPSILEDNLTWNNGTGSVLTGFNHDVVLPKNYTAKNYLENQNGYCLIIYNLQSDKGNLNLYNGNLIGSGHLVNFTSNADMNFRSEYDIVVNTKIDKSVWNKYCTKKNKKGVCTQWVYKCEFKNSEIKTDKLVLNDNLFVKYYPDNLQAGLKIKDKYLDTTKFNLTTGNFSSLNLKFLNSGFNEYNYVYSVVENNSILQIKADKLERKDINNLFIENNDILVKDISNCKLTLFDHFTSKIFPCDFNYTDLDIKIETDKLIYSENETIKVIIEPYDKEFNVTYGNISKVVKGNVEFTAKYSNDIISISDNGRDIEKVIHVKDNQSLSIFFVLSLFTGANYTIGSLIKKYWGVLV